MEKLVFPMGFMSHSGISSNESESWEIEEEWEGGLRIWFAYFPTSQSPQGGIHIRTRKGGGQGIKWIIGSFFEIRGMSSIKRVGEVGKSGGLGSPSKHIITKHSNSCFEKYQFKYSSEISLQRWRNRLQNFSIYSLGSQTTHSIGSVAWQANPIERADRAFLWDWFFYRNFHSYTYQRIDEAPQWTDKGNGWK